MILKIPNNLYIPTNQTLLKLQPQNNSGKLDNAPLRALPSLILKISNSMSETVRRLDTKLTMTLENPNKNSLVECLVHKTNMLSGDKNLNIIQESI